MAIAHTISRTFLRVMPLCLVIAACATTVAQSEPLPQIVNFVAPVYPQLAVDGLIPTTAVTKIKVGKDGRVIEANLISAHAIFAKNVLAAIKQWTFTPSQQEYEFEVVCRFEFYLPDDCSSNEMIVSAKLPSSVLVRAAAPHRCYTITTHDPVEHR